MAKHLRASAVDVVLDQFLLEQQAGGPDEGFEIWSQREAKRADKILIIASQGYAQAYELQGEAGQGRGVMGEAVVMRELIKGDDYRVKKIRVAVLDEADLDHVPLELKRLRYFRAYREDELAELIRWLQTPVASPIRLSRIPAAPHTFVGRGAELQALRDHGLKNARVLAIALQGPGGAGKTALARKFAEEVKDRLPTQFFLDLQGYSPPEHPLTPAQFAGRVIHHFIPGFELPENDAVANLQEQYRKAIEGKNMLLIADNYQASIVSQEELEMLLPPSGSLLLLTSRDTINIRAIKTVYVDQMPPADAVSLLRFLGSDLDDECDDAFCRLAELSGYLPLALQTNAAALTNNRTLTVARLCEILQDARKRVEPVEAALQVSYDLLPPDLQSAWCKLAIFPSRFDARAAAAVLDCAEATAENQIGELGRRSLLSCERVSRRAWFHDLARLFAAQILQASGELRENAEQRYAEYYAYMVEEISSAHASDALIALKHFDVESVNFTTAWKWAASVANCDPKAEALKVPDSVDDFPSVSFASNGVGERCCRVLETYSRAASKILILRDKPREQIGWLRIALGVAKSLDDRKAEAEAAIGLGHALRNLSNVRRSIEFFERGLALVRELASESSGRRLECDAMLGIAGGCRMLGDQRRALKLYREVLRIARKNKERLAECEALINVGSVFRSGGMPFIAIKFFHKSLKIAIDLRDKRAEGVAVGSLGNALRELGKEPLLPGKVREAITRYEEQHKIAQIIGHRRAEGNALGNIGTAWRMLGDWDKALQFYEECLLIAREVEDRTAEGAALYNLAKTHKELGNLDTAVALVKEALKVKEDIEDPYTERARNSLWQWERTH